MGMAASQARLLTLTARMHDLEYEAQSLQNAKLQLATQQDAIYDEYQRALDATTLTYVAHDTYGNSSNVIATFNNLFSSNAGLVNHGNNYALLDSNGRVVVENNLYEGYHDFKDSSYPQNAYMFALFMLYGDTNGQISGQDWNNTLSVINDVMRAGFKDNNGKLKELYLNAVFGNGSKGIAPPPPTPIAADNFSNLLTTTHIEEANEFMEYFFNNYSSQIFNNENIPEGTSASFNYYVRMYTAMEKNGCISIDDFNGPSGYAANDSDWLTNMIQTGQFTIEMFKKDSSGHYYLAGMTVNSDTNLNFTLTTQVDKTALAKAEAKYEHALKQLDRKDKKYDMELSKLETERNALDKQFESMKTVVKENVERTFKIFS